MDSKSNKEQLFSEFPPVSTEEWEAKIRTDLKGADYEKKLVWKTTEGINVKPYYRAEDLEKLEYLNVPPCMFPYIRGNKAENHWSIRQDIDEVNPDKANKAALDAISRGGEAIGFNAKEVEDHDDMKTLLEGINLSKVDVHFLSASSYFLIYNLFLEELLRQRINGNKAKGGFNFDPLSYFLLYGKFYHSQEENFEEAAELLNNIKVNLPVFKGITINGKYFHNAGSTIVQELAFSLASGNEYLVKLTDKGIAVDDITPRIQFVFAMDSNYFMEIAKLRVAKLIWAKIVEQFHPTKEESMKMHIHAVNSFWNKSVYDPYVNLLRNTTEAMSAAIGGCDSMTVIPFDSTFKKPDNFSERNARNTQILLKEEAYLDKIVDPTAGSYYIENLTDSITNAAWKLFLQIEEHGGFIKSVESGFIKEEIRKTCKQRDRDIAMGRQIILGTNHYPEANGNMLDKIHPRTDLSQLSGLKQYRGAQAFEALRLSTEAFEKDGNKRPSVFLFTYGNLSMRKARANFSSNFFGCVGYNIMDNPGFANADEGIKGAIESGAEIIVLCSGDDEYAALAKAVCTPLKMINPDLMIVVAGNPVAIIEELKQQGVDDFEFMTVRILWKH